MGLKVQYRRPILTLCDGNYNRLGILSNKTQRSCYNVNLTKKVNEVSVLSFDIPSDNLIDYNSTELLVKFGLDYYIIKDVTLSSTDRSMYSVSAEHESTELKGILVSMISEDDSDTEIIGESPEGMWSLLVDSCSIPEIIKNKYIFETDIVDTYRSLEVEDEKGLYEHLVNIAKQFEACLIFEHNEEGKILIKLIAGEIDNKRVVKKGKDLRQLNITLDSSAIFTKIIPFGAVDSETGLEINIMDVTQDGKSYITNYDYYLDQGMTLNEIKNTPKCNQECIYRNSDIVDANELLRVATKELEQISKPVLHGNIDIINLGCMEGYFENTPVLCERIYVADKVGKYNIFSKVVGVSINYDNPLKSKVEISNVVRYSSTFADIVRTSEVVSKVTTKKKGKPVLSAEKVQGIIDAHTTQIKNKLLGGAEHQGDKLAILFEDVRTDSDTYGAIALGTSGILISSEKDINGEWLWTTAIDSQGLSTKIVNAITINGAQVNAGKISSFDGSSWWNLDNNEFNFGDKIKFIDGTFSIELGNGLENLVTKEDLEEVKDLIDDVDERLDTALGDIDRAFKEGIIGEVEKRVIEKTLKTLLDQYSNAEYLYEIYKVSENLTDETKTTLNARWRLYDASYTELTNYINEIIADEKCTETELASYNLKVEEYYARYSELKNLLEYCQIEASNNYTNTKVSISEGNIKTEIEGKYVKVDEAVNYTVICDNEHQGIPVDMLRKPLTTNTYRFNIAIYKGGAGTQQEFTIDSITGTGSGITYTKYDKYITMKVSKDTAISDLEGSIDVALTCNGFKFNKKITWNAVLNGEKGDSAEVVSIEASSLIFKYNNETQVYSPTNITLNPVFKNCAFQSWKYSINGGITYNTLATINGITKDTNNKLTISSTCALFTSSVTSIQFKVTSSAGTTDQVTLTRLRDGVDGLDGLDGGKGEDGKTYYTWVKYADTPTSGMSELPDGKTYIGLAYNKETNVESTNYADYKWSLIKGENGLDGEKGKDGKTYYTWLKYADTPTSGMSDDPTNKKYMGLAYNKESKIESTNYADYSWSLIKGNDGTNAINVVLSNESHTFVADHYGCPIPTSITNNVYGYSGTKQVNTNIGKIIGLPEGMSVTVKNNNTTNTQIIINVAETMRIESGTISIPVICNGVTVNKVFTYSLAKNGVDAKIVVINATSQVFKSTDGGINYTPNSITVIASYQNCSHSKWQYSTNNDLTFRDLTNGTGGITVNGTTLTIPKTCSLFTSTTNCINIKAIGVDENVYDTVTIFKLLDRADINDVLDEQNSKITTVEKKYSTLEQDLDGFKTEVGQTYTTIEEFRQLKVGGGDNLLRNGNFADGLDHWRIDGFDNAGTEKTITVQNTPSQWIPKNKNALVIGGLKTNERYGVSSAIMKLAPYTKYVVSGYCAGHRVGKITVTMRDADNNGVHVVSKDISPVSGGDSLSKWTRFEIPFTTTANGNYNLSLYSNRFNADGSTNTGYVWFTDVQVEEGTKATPWKKCILDITDAVDDVSDSVTNLNTYIEEAFKDGILDKTERQAIEQQLKTLKAEKADIDKEYTTLNSNAKLTGTPKTTLTTAYNDYVSKYNSLVTSINNILNAQDITDSLRNSYNTAYTNHNNSLATYRKAYIDAFNSITTNYIETMKQALLEEIDDVQDSVDNLNTYIDGAFKDGILDKTEKQAIKQQLKTLSSEKADIDNEYAVVINNGDLTGTPKTNLTSAYNDYVSKYNSLVTSINNILNATLVTPTLRNSYDTAYTNHNSSLATLKQRHIEAINAIAETKKKFSIKTSQTYTDAKLTTTADAIRGTVSQLREDFDNLEIGGENLIKNSEFVTDAGWYFASGTSVDTSRKCFDSNSLKISHSGLSADNWNGATQYPVTNANAGEKYTMSYYYYVDDVSTLDNDFCFEVKANRSDGSSYYFSTCTAFNKSTCKVKTWTKVSFTVTLAENFASLMVYPWVKRNGTVWFSRPKLEKGNRATDYSPASSTYATKSEMELTSEQFKVTFQKSGSGNLLKNSDCQFGLNGQWVNNGGGLSIEIANAKPFVGSRESYFRTSFPNGMKYSETVYLKPNTDYVYQAYVYVGSSMSGAKLSPVHFWSWVANSGTSATSGQAGVTILDYKQDVKVGEFILCYIHFKTLMQNVPIGFLPFIYSSATVSHVAVKQICLKEGKTPSIWIPHSSEINEGITTINEDGIQVSHSNIKTKTRMTADGFYFLDENDDMFASLSSKDTWASLHVQEVFANNIENIYTGNASLYVNHSKTSAGDGSSSSPFNSFGVLKEYLESMPIINKDLTII